MKERQRLVGKSPWEYLEPCDTIASFEYRPAGEPENPWGDVIFSRGFEREIGPIIERKLEAEGIGDDLVKFVKDLCADLKTDKKLEPIVPRGEPCGKCGRSHEANEFVKAVLFYVASKVFDSRTESLLRELQE